MARQRLVEISGDFKYYDPLIASDLIVFRPRLFVFQRVHAYQF